MKLILGFRVFIIVLQVVTFGMFLVTGVHASAAHCDFNGDGFDDLAVGVPNEEINSVFFAGAVHVFYGRSTGLSVTNNQFIQQPATDFDRFGWALACGDFNADGRDDLAVGAPGVDVGTSGNAGGVYVFYASPTGRLNVNNRQFWAQNNPLLMRTADSGDSFGAAVAAGDFNGDGFEDLAIGVEHETLGAGKDGAGAVHILFGSGVGLTATGNQFWTEDSPGIPGDASTAKSFGHSLVAANFGNDTASDCYDDLAIGVPFNEGSVKVIYGSATGLTSTGAQSWKLIAGTESFFGNTVAAGSFRQLNAACGLQRISDLVVGAPGDVNSIENGGATFVIYGTLEGLTSTNSQMWTQNSAGIADSMETEDQFGWALATGHSNANGPFLVIGSPGESVVVSSTAVPFAGAIHVLFTDPSTGLLTSAGSSFIHQNTPGVKDKVEDNDEFGYSLGMGDFNADGNDDIVAGASNEDVGTINSAGAITILYSATTDRTQFLHQNTEDVKDVAEESDEFGLTITQ